MHKLLSRHGADIVNHYNYGDRLVSRTAVDPTGSYAITSKIIYDTDGESIGFCVDTNINPADCPEEKIGVPLGVYLYEKNLQGDVVKVIHGATGTVLANFSYDAYGNLEVHADDIGEVIGAILVLAITPQLYRGYIYVPLGDNLCYYLGSRFYNPQLGRFLNADKHTDTGTGVVGTNMFAYCNNNPVMFIDPTGEAFEWAITGGFAVAALYAIMITGIVMVALQASGITVSFGEVLSAAIDALAEQTKFKATQIKAIAKTLIASLTISAAENELIGIAKSYNRFECRDAVKEMERYLKKKGFDYYVIQINYPLYPGFVYSLASNPQYNEDEIRRNGKHYGILFNGKVYCTVHPSGWEENMWINDFVGVGTKRVLYFDKNGNLIRIR